MTPKLFESIQLAIAEECQSVRDLLLTKNLKYGGAAFESIGVFSKLGLLDQINVRIDDKLRRIQASGPATSEGRVTDEDTALDLIGYLILRRVVQRVQSRNQEQSNANRSPVCGS